tara:strand:- start:4969 stop:6909 length:1941 start_codon:yes stop_codon:yes gene_type:complete
MGLSAGGFFKNFVKGAAQQYNTNVAYVEQQKVEEEKAIKKEERQFGFDTRLQKQKLDYTAALEKAKPDKDKKFHGKFAYKKPDAKGNTTLDIPMTEGYSSLANTKAKYNNALDTYSAFIPKLPDLKKTLTPIGYNNLVNQIITSYTGASTLKDGSVEGQDIEVVFDAARYPAISQNDDLMTAFALKIQQTKKQAIEYIRLTSPTAIVDDKAKLKIGNNNISMSIEGFYGADNTNNTYFKPEDVMTVKRSILNTSSNKEVIQWMKNENQFMIDQNKDAAKFGSGYAAFTGSDLVNAIAVGQKALGNLSPSAINDLTPQLGTEIKNRIRELPNGNYIVNDPQVFHRVLKNIMPRRINPPIRMIGGQASLNAKAAILTRKYGRKGAEIPLNSVAKADQASKRLINARSIDLLVGEGASTGFSAGIQSKLVGFKSQLVELAKRMSFFKTADDDSLTPVISGLNSTATNIESRINNAPETVSETQKKAGVQTKEQVIKDALLKYSATLMIFDIATMAQDSGGGFTSGGTAVRLSDGDVAMSSKALASALLEIPGAVQAVALQVAELAEREMVIFEMIANGDADDARAALVMHSAFRGELSTLVDTIKNNPRGLVTNEKAPPPKRISLFPKSEVKVDNNKVSKKKINKNIIK